ncbi:MAG: DNA polymerase I, partial [Kiloniellaceae bacterium]
MGQPAETHEHHHHLYLIDGSGYIFRAFHALPPMTRPDGTPVNAVFGFVNMLIKLLADTEAEGIAVVFDATRETFRNEIYPAYKANRPEPPEELIPQFALIREATRAFNVPCVETDNYEADDLIATYAKAARERGLEVTIVSSDKDLMQLVEPGVTMLDPVKNRAIGPAEVEERFGVPPEKVGEVQALAGDPTDNVPGVPGIGVKTAAQLIQEYGDLETLLAHAGEIRQPKRRENLVRFADQARVSRRLVELKDDVPVEVPLEELRLRAPDPGALRAFLEENAFRSVIARLGEVLGEGAAAAPAEGGEAAYELVQDMDALSAWIEAAFEEGVVAVDTETTSLDALRAELVGVSLALEPGRACYIPLGHTARKGDGELDLEGAGEPPGQIPMDAALAALKPLLEDPGVLKVGQNIKYDVLVLGRHGIEIMPTDDTMLLSYVLEGGLHGHGMDELARLHLGHDTIKFKDVAGAGKAQVSFDQVPLEVARDYAAEDADVTLRLHRVLKPRLVPERLTTVYETLERPLVPVLAAMERAGVKVDRDSLRELSNDFARRIAELEERIYQLAGRRFTIGSPKQLGEILFDEMSLAGTKKGKSGAYTTDAGVLEALTAQGHDLPARVLDWRQLSKLKSTYTDALQAQINPDTGRVHTSFSQAVASTGRLASSDPNLQNIPVRTEEGRKIRHAFVAEAGFKLLSVDYSQIELRLAAHIAEVGPLRQAFHEGRDIHAITAAQVFGVPVEGMDPMIRRKAKAINFGIIYGISAFGLANNLGIPQGEAQAYIDAYFARYPGIRDYMERTKAACRERGYVETLFGRRIHMPGIKDKNPARRNFAERAAINAPIQGTAADIIKRAMIRVPPALAAAGLSARMLLQVHDELLFEVPEHELDRTAAVVKAIMENASRPVVELSVPLTADVGIGPNWAEAH